MKVKAIKVSNFKGIDNLEIPFNGKSTIIFGINGVGKSTILRAIDLIYANFISMLVSSKKKLVQLEYDDISYGKTSAKIDVVFELSDGNKREYSRSISRTAGRKHNLAELRELVNSFEKQHLEKVRGDAQYEDRSLLAVKKAMLAMLDGFDDIHIDRKPLAMKVKRMGSI